MALHTTAGDEMPSSPMEPHEPVNCDPSQPPTMLWAVKATDKCAIYDDLGVSDLVGEKAPPTHNLPPPLRHHTTPTDHMAVNSQPPHPGAIMPVVTTPSFSTRSEAGHIHDRTSCSCKRNLMDDIKKSALATDSFSCLADEILLHIFKWLPLTKLSQCGVVCKRWYRLVFDESLWRRINLSSKKFLPHILGSILERGPLAVKLSRAKIKEPVFAVNSKIKEQRQWRKVSKLSITSKVQYLDLSACDVSPSALSEIIKTCPPLRKLSLESCMVNNSVLTDVSQKAQEMQELNLCMCEGVLNHGMMQLLQNLTNLSSLNLAWTSLSKETLATLAAVIPTNLEKLNLSGCTRNLEDDIINKILLRCPRLRELDISDTTTVSEALYDGFINHGNIQYLALNRCYSLHYSNFEHLAAVRSLRALDLYGLIPDQAYDSVKELFPGVIFNEHPYSAIARPTIKRKDHIWGIKCYE